MPHLSEARPHSPGGPLFVPPQGKSRLDNADLYAVLYLSETAAGSIAEAFGRYHIWSRSMLKGPELLGGSVWTLVTYERRASAKPICDLDDPRALVKRALRPSHVVSRRYELTQAWAKAIFLERRWAGVRWWSFYESQWANVGLWDLRGLSVTGTDPLTIDHPAVVNAADELSKPVVANRRSI